jgi:hypothetical protein
MFIFLDTVALVTEIEIWFDANVEDFINTRNDYYSVLRTPYPRVVL